MTQSATTRISAGTGRADDEAILPLSRRSPPVVNARGENAAVGPLGAGGTLPHSGAMNAQELRATAPAAPRSGAAPVIAIGSDNARRMAAKTRGLRVVRFIALGI